MAKPSSTHLNLQDSETQADFSIPFSIPSQPPDIKNWFSSFEYESPDSLEIPCGIDPLELLANSDSETQHPFEILGFQNGENSPAAKDDGHPSEERSWDESRRSTDPIRLNDGQNSPQHIGRKSSDGIGRGLPIAIVNSVIDLSERPLTRLKREPEIKRAISVEGANDDDLNTNGKRAKSEVEDDMLQNKQVHLNSAGGFISTKKREISRLDRENRAATNGSKEGGTRELLVKEDMKENNGISVRREVLQEARTNALADRTNIHIHVEQAVPGKWQCPRKRKPYIGPPLKQLRLEQWVRRPE